MVDLFIIGVGNIGKRHIQAAFNSKSLLKINCFDIHAETLNSIDEFITANGLDLDRIVKHSTFEKWCQGIKPESIVIVATTAAGRLNLLSEVIKRTPSSIIVEKPVVQSDDDYTAIAELAKQYQVNIFVNFIAHAQQVYQDVLKSVAEGNEFTMSTKMPKWGISTVGIHQLELFLWLGNIKSFKTYFAQKHETYEQKRPGFYDIAGTIFVDTDCGFNATITSFISDEGPSSIQFSLSGKTITIYESLGKYTIASKNNGVEIKDLKIRFVSQYMTEVIDDLVNTGNTYLPNLDESYAAHKILFDYLEHINEKQLNIT